MLEHTNEVAHQQALVEQALHCYKEEHYCGWPDQMTPYEAEELLRSRPDLVVAYEKIVDMGKYGINQINLSYFLDFLKKSPDYLESLLPVFKVAPALFPIYTAYAHALEALPKEKRTDERFYDTRISKTPDATLVIHHLQEIQSLVEKIKATTPEDSEKTAMTAIFDNSIEVHVVRTNAHNMLGIAIWIGSSKDTAPMKQIAPLTFSVTGAGLINTQEHAGQNNKLGYLYQPESTKVDEKALLEALATFPPGSAEIRRALEANTVLEDWLTR